MIESWVKELDFLSPYLKEKLEADEEHTWKDAPYIPEEVKKLIRKKEPINNYSPAYFPTFHPLNYCISSQEKSIEASTRQIQENIASQQIQSLENETNALLRSIAQQQQNERIISALCSNIGYIHPPAYYPLYSYNPCSQYYPFC